MDPKKPALGRGRARGIGRGNFFFRRIVLIFDQKLLCRSSNMNSTCIIFIFRCFSAPTSDQSGPCKLLFYVHENCVFFPLLSKKSSVDLKLKSLNINIAYFLFFILNEATPWAISWCSNKTTGPGTRPLIYRHCQTSNGSIIDYDIERRQQWSWW